MSKRFIVAAVMMLVGMAGTANAATITATVNCRSAPATTGRVVAMVQAGTTVTVLSRLGTWRLVDQVRAGCWVASRYVQEPGNGMVTDAYATVQTRTYAQPRGRAASRGSYGISRPRNAIGSYARRSTSRRTRSSGFGDGGDGSCPCSGSNICIGPRGGRYCITSGGNKRYGV